MLWLIEWQFRLHLSIAAWILYSKKARQSSFLAQAGAVSYCWLMLQPTSCSPLSTWPVTCFHVSSLPFAHIFCVFQVFYHDGNVTSWQVLYGSLLLQISSESLYFPRSETFLDLVALFYWSVTLHQLSRICVEFVAFSSGFGRPLEKFLLSLNKPV